MRVTIDKALDEVGVPLRTFQNMCARGEVPGAAKVGHEDKPTARGGIG